MTDGQFENEAKALRSLLITTAGKILGSTDEAEDVVQETLLKLWKMKGTLAPPVAPLATVMTCHAAIDRLRRIEARHETALTAGSDRAEEDETDPRAARMTAAIDMLPRIQQTVMRMRLAEGMEYKDIALLVSTSEQNVRQILSRARKAVLKNYTEQ